MIRCGDMGMGGKEGTREGNVRLCKMGIQTGFLYTEIFDNEGNRLRKTKD